jgi:ABC-type Fe3+ transport system permease subunit
MSQLRDGGAGILSQVWRDNSPELWNTICLSSFAAAFVSLLALALVSSWKTWPPRSRNVALFLCALPFLFPPITLGIALVGFFNRDVFALVYGGIAPSGFPFLDWVSENSARYAMMIIGYTARFLPLAIVLLWEAARRVDDSQLEAARNVGATSWEASRAILWPLMLPAFLCALALLWALTAAELTVSVLVNQPGGQTLPVPIFNLMHIGSTAQVAALSLTLFALTSLAVFCMTIAAAAFALNWKRKP